MGFPESVANKALVLCGRCCCICHKFCGTKIELHHIEQKAYGGEDTLENCIPLCFDCHSDMGKADPKHPKGKRYTKEELIHHRDNWYKKVEGSAMDHSDSEISENDIKTFQEICSIFNLDMKYWLNEADLGGSHPYHVFDPLSKYMYNCDNPFSEFINVEMEKLRGNLIFSIKRFLSYKAVNTFIKIIGDENYGITRSWMINHEDWIPYNTDMSYEEYSEKYEKEAEELNQLATDVWNSYCDLVRQGRRILKL